MIRIAMAGLAGLVAVAPLAAPAAAQAAAPAAPTRTMPAELRDGRWGISFGVFSGGGSVGWFRMTSARNAFTLDVRASGQLTLGDQESSEFGEADTEQLYFRAAVEPGFRRYRAARGDVASYFAGNLSAGVDGQVYEVQSGDYYRYTESWAPFGGVGMGIGLEWFVTDALSLRGQVGGSVEYQWRQVESAGGPAEVRREHVIRGALGATGLSGSIWF